jgi:hypothetical protein
MKRFILLLIAISTFLSCTSATPTDSNVWSDLQKKSEFISPATAQAREMLEKFPENQTIVITLGDRGTFYLATLEINAIIQIFESYGYYLHQFEYKKVLIFRKKETNHVSNEHQIQSSSY